MSEVKRYTYYQGQNGLYEITDEQEKLDLKAEEVTRILNGYEALQAENERLRDALIGLIDVANNSEGVAGWHRNGDILPWAEVEELTIANDALYPPQLTNGGGDE